MLWGFKPFFFLDCMPFLFHPKRPGCINGLLSKLVSFPFVTDYGGETDISEDTQGFQGSSATISHRDLVWTPQTAFQRSPLSKQGRGQTGYLTHKWRYCTASLFVSFFLSWSFFFHSLTHPTNQPTKQSISLSGCFCGWKPSANCLQTLKRSFQTANFHRLF